MFYFHRYDEYLYNLLTKYYLSWGIIYFYDNSQFKIRQCNTIYAIEKRHKNILVPRTSNISFERT